MCLRRSNALLLCRVLLLGFAGAICVSGAYADKAAKPVKVHKESKRADAHEIEALEEKWRTAVLKGDFKSLEALLDDDFLGISANGTISNKEQYLHRLETRQTQISSFDVTAIKVRVEPATIIATSQARVVGQLEGRPINGIFRYTKVYGKNSAGQWRVLNFEATHVAGPQVNDPDMHGGIPIDGRIR